MIAPKTAIIFLSLFALTPADESPFCATKACTCNTNQDGLAVECVSVENMKQLLKNSSNWAMNGTLYPYQNFTVHNSVDLMHLDIQFPNGSLKVLDLSENKIASLNNSIFKNLQNMEVLILSHNLIDTIDPEAFKGQYMEGDYQPLRSLKVLKLDNNKIHSLNQDLFEHTSRVETLSLSHNPLKVLDHHTIVAIDNLMYLKELDLSFTELATLPQYFLHTPRYLTWLNLTGNKIQELPETLGDAQRLEILILNDNPIVNLTHKNIFPKMPSLRVLHMCQMKNLTNVGRRAFTQLTNLSKLYLAANERLIYIDDNALCDRIEEFGPAPICPPIKELYLNDNKLTHINEPLVGRWDKLEQLDLENNAWTCECENQWFIEELIPYYLKLNEQKAKNLRCAAPVEMQQYTFYELYQKKSHMRCLDKYGNRPERDAVMLVGVLIGILLTIAAVSIIIYSYQRQWFGFCEGKSPAAYSRRFYRPTGNEDFSY